VVVHAFGVATCMQGKGLGTAMMHAVMDMARSAGKKAIRLDLIDHNRGVEHVYTGMGFRKCGELKLFYAEVGWQMFHLFEFTL
jgi:ribosomal protein S18 acetylase RimI-like enzyme